MSLVFVLFPSGAQGEGVDLKSFSTARRHFENYTPSQLHWGDSIAVLSSHTHKLEMILGEYSEITISMRPRSKRKQVGVMSKSPSY